MKPPFLLLSFCSSFAALLALPYSVELAISPLVVTGLLLMLRADYGRRFAPLDRPSRTTNTTEGLRLAA